MGAYIPNTEKERREMLKAAGFSDFSQLYADIPQEIRQKGSLALPPGQSELSVRRTMEKLAGDDQVFSHIFRGAGSYHHYIPAIVDEIATRERFVTAYTPYQAEISQGILQSIFEYQTMICQLTGMEVSNASVYDGATAAAEAAAMCIGKKRHTVLVSGAADPGVRRVMETYCFGSGSRYLEIPEKDGVTDREKLSELLSDETACVYVQQPSYYGCLEDMDSLCEMAHGAGAKLIAGCNPISLAVLKTPGEYGADIAVGEGQPLGIPMAFGGPYLGFMAATKEMFRKLPGRIVGQTVDRDGKRGFVLTLQAREQHIRREKAGSNICSNEALCAMRAAVYLAAMGAEGLEEAAKQCAARAHYLQKALEGAGLPREHSGEFFHEFVTVSHTPAEAILEALERKGILGGLPLDERRILWCATEMNTREEIDETAAAVKEVTGA